MKVISEIIPNTHGIKNALKRIDYSDTYSTTNHIDNIEHLANLIFTKLPNWISFLMKTRNLIMKTFGLKIEKPSDYNTNFKIGGYLGFFKIYEIMNNEIILGANDKHLNFRVSIFNSQDLNYNIKVSTLVEYNNRLGKIYFAIIGPLHHLIIKQIVKKRHISIHKKKTF